MITIHDVESAYERISRFILNTPCVFSQALSEQTGAQVYLKLDNMQRTGSFKERGALNRLLLLSDEEKSKGVVTASAGNHAQAVAYHASRLHIQSTIFMPQYTPVIKATKTESYGAKINFAGDNYDDAHAAAVKFAQETGAYYLHAYDDDGVIAGQGTLALEIIKQLPNVDTLVVSVGGGGLIAGIALAMKALKPNVEIIGVEPEALPSMAKAIENKAPFALPAAHTLADGIRVRRVGEKTFDICSRLVHQWATVIDDEVAKGILFLLEMQKTVTEGAGAAGVAALQSGRLGDLKNKVVCIVIGGGNIDVNLLERVIERGMVNSGRMVRLAVNVHDRPGELGELLRAISSTRANVIEVHHERAFAKTVWNDVEIDLVLETRGTAHVTEILSLIRSKGYAVSQTTRIGEG